MVFQHYNQLPVPHEANTEHVNSSTGNPQPEGHDGSYDKAISSSASVTTLLPSRSSSPTANTSHAGARSLDKTGHLKPTRYVPGSVALSPWGFQSLAMVLAIVSFIGLVITAAKFAGRPLSDWSLSFLSINALAAILTTTMRGALLVPVADSMGQAKWAWFAQRQREPRNPEESILSRPLRDLQYIDDASRGPWGSFVWLSRNLFRLDWDVSVGALITILSAGLSVFPQQLITVNVRSIPHQRAAHMIWANNITQMNETESRKASYAGIYGAEIPDLPISCPTANCTWEPLLSLGVCGSCLDITDNMPDSWMSCAGNFCNYTSSSPFPRPDRLMENGLRSDANTTWSFENNSNTPNFNIRQTSIQGLADTSYVPLDNPLATPEMVESWPLLLSSGFEVITVPVVSIETHVGKTVDFRITSGKASVTQCRFWYCLKAIDANVSSGLAHQSVHNAETHYDGSSNNSVKLSSGGGSDIGNNTFSIQHDELSEYSLASAIDIYPFIVGYQDLTLLIGSGSKSADDGSEYLDFWWNLALPDLDGWADRVAKSLSNLVRLQNQVLPEDDVHAGVAYSEETYIRVEWTWIIYPAVVISVTLLYVLASIAKTIRLERKVWGNGLLPLILFEVDDDIRDKGRQACGSNDDLIKEIGKERVHFNGFGR